MHMGPVGVATATAITDSLTAGMCYGILAIALVACAAYAVACAVLSQWTDTWGMNGAAGYGQNEELGDIGG